MSKTPEFNGLLFSRDALPLVRTYLPKDISSDREYLQIQLNGQPFQLKLTDVGDAKLPIVIAWLDTHPDHTGVDPRLPKASAHERAHLINLLNQQSERPITTIVTPDSSKSIPSIQQTVNIASELLHRDISLIILPGGKVKEEVQQQSALPVITYQNVTSGGKDKYLGITEEGIYTLREQHAAGNGIITIDDVYTTGGTDGAVQDTINQTLGLPKEVRHPLIVVAREAGYKPGYPPPMPNHVYPLINLPEFVGGLPAK